MRSSAELSPAALAYLGDAVYELHIRRLLLWPPKRLGDYHNQVIAQTRAEKQAQHLLRLLPDLTEEEQGWVRRGRNSAGSGPRRLESGIYGQASALETLLGFLYITDPERLEELLGRLEVP